MGSATARQGTQSARQVSDVAGQAIRHRDWPAAVAAANRLVRIAPEDPAALTRALQAYVMAGDTTLAGQLARTAQPHWATSPRLAELAILALGRCQDRPMAAAAARAALGGGVVDLRLAAIIADALTQAGHPSEAITALEGAGVRQSGDARAWYELARAQERHGDDPVGILADARHALALAPDNLRAVELVARLLLDNAMPQAATAVLASVAEDRRNTTLRLLLVEALVARKDFHAAAPLARQLAEGSLSSHPMIRRMTGVLMRAGQADLARTLYEANLETRQRALPQRFATGVGALMAAPQQYRGTPAAAQLDWIWQQLAATGRAPADRSAWVREVTSVAALDRLFLDWMECRPDAGDEALALIDGIGPARDLLTSALASGKGAFVAAAHVGLLFGGLATLALSGLPMTFVASVPRLGQRSGQGSGQRSGNVTLVSTASQDEAAIGRALHRSLRAGRVVAVAIDGASGRGKALHPLFDRTIALSDFIPRLAWKTGAASFFPRVVWTGDRVSLTLRPLPDPGPHETSPAYEAAWMQAYLAEVKSLLLDHPGSARASGGFWGRISA